MQLDLSKVVSDREKAGEYSSEVVHVWMHRDPGHETYVRGFGLLIRIGGELYRFDIRKCDAGESFPEEKGLEADLADRHEDLHALQNLAHKMSLDFIHLFDELRYATPAAG